jgi:phosphate-selective porin OprO/OprP
MNKKLQVFFGYCTAISMVLVVLSFYSATAMAELPSLPELDDAVEVPEDTLIRKVTLIDPAANSKDRVINVLIKAGKLEIVSEDKISSDEANLILDANGGFILGKLEVGAAPSFIILDTDPRKEFDVMTDTKRYSVVVVRDGYVVKNRLLDEIEDDPDDEPVKSGWLAYTPPPFAVPLNYQDTSKWNRFDTKYISGIFVSAMVLDRTNWLSQNSVSESQFGDLDSYSGGEIRGFRIGMVGTLNMFEKPWIYTIFGATNAFDKGFEVEEQDSFALFDWRLDIPFFNNSVMSIGKQKEPISGERIQSMAYNQMQERTAVSDALLPSRNVGVVWNGSSPEKYSTWAFGAFNDWFDADQNFSESASQLIGRVTWAPLRSGDDSNLVHIGAGYRYSDAKEGFRYLTEPEFNKAPVFVDTGFGTETGRLPANNINSWNLELSWRKGPFLLSSEYTRSDVDNPQLGNPSFDGYWVAASWVLTGEMRPYSKKNGTFGIFPISRSVYQSGKGAWELSTRFSHIDLNDSQIMGGEMDVASLGLSWWLTPFFNLNANYRYIWNEFDGQNGTSSGINTRIVLVLE